MFDTLFTKTEYEDFDSYSRKIRFIEQMGFQQKARQESVDNLEFF